MVIRAVQRRTARAALRVLETKFGRDAMKLSSILCLCAAAPALSGSASASVIVVDSAGSGFTEIQPAVDSAVDGDTILIVSGAYQAFGVRDKALAIVGDASSDVRIDGTIRIGELAPEKTLVLANLSAYGNSRIASLGYGLYLSSNHGRVLVEDCTFAGFSSPATLFIGVNGQDAVRIENCRDVALVHTVAVGGDAGVHNAGNLMSGSGVHAELSTVSVFDSHLLGGMGMNADPNGIGLNGATADTDAGVKTLGCSRPDRSSWVDTAAEAARDMASRKHSAAMVVTESCSSTDRMRTRSKTSSYLDSPVAPATDRIRTLVLQEVRTLRGCTARSRSLPAHRSI